MVLNLFSGVFGGESVSYSMMRWSMSFEVGKNKYIDNWYAFELKLIRYFEL